MNRKPKQQGYGRQPKGDSPQLTPPSIKRNEDGNDTYRESGRDADARQAENKPQWTSYTEAVCAVLLVLITGLYTHYANQQAAAAIRATEAARDALEVSHRPWIGMVDAKVNLGANIAPAEWSLGWKNYGNSPALSADFFTRLAWFDSPPDWRVIKDVEDAMVLQGAVLTLFPSEVSARTAVGTAGPPQWKEKWLAGNVTIILMGKATYRDQFGQKHLTVFCRRLMPTNGRVPERLVNCQFDESAN